MILFLFLVFAAVFTGSCALCLHIGYRFGLEDREPARPAVPDPFAEDTSLERDRWAEQLEVWLAEDAAAEPAPIERLVAAAGQVGERTDTAGLLHPHKHLADTGELRALALAGEAEEIAVQTAAYKKEIDAA
jgi:hypothetical protein